MQGGTVLQFRIERRYEKNKVKSDALQNIGLMGMFRTRTVGHLSVQGTKSWNKDGEMELKYI